MREEINSMNNFQEMREQYKEVLRLRNYDTEWINAYLAEFDEIVSKQLWDILVPLMESCDIQIRKDIYHMENLRPVYRNVKDWAILSERTIHDFSDSENSIEVVEVLIGTLHYEYLSINQHYEERRTPIIRWITRNKYDYLCANEDTIIW